MFGEALVIGIVIMLAVVVVAVVVAKLVFGRRSGSGNSKEVPPPVDPGPTHPEQARDVNAEK